MDRLAALKGLFVVAGLYDGILGLAFLVAGPRIFESFGVAPPNHWGYVQFPALLLMVFAIMFFQVAADPVGRRGLMPYGMLLKASYCAVTLYHWMGGTLPRMWQPFTIADLVFLVLFAWAWSAARLISPHGQGAGSG